MKPTTGNLFTDEGAAARLQRMQRLDAERPVPRPPAARPPPTARREARTMTPMQMLPKPQAAPTEPIDFVIDDGPLGEKINALMADLRMSVAFADRGIDCPTHVLFSAPSGCGKTLCARWMGQQLGLPTQVVQIDQIVGSHLGETAGNLRKEFDRAVRDSAILFLDEIDAICTRRRNTDSSSASEEMQRSTSALLQLLDSLPPEAIAIAATNLPEKLDDALRRRLPVEIEFTTPGKSARAEMVRRWLARADLGETFAANVVADSDGLSGAAFRSLVMARARDAIRAGGAA